MAANHDWLSPVWDQARYVADNDWFAENYAAKNVADCSVRRLPHLLEAKLFNTCLIWSDSCTFDSDTMLLDCAARTRTYALKRPADIKVKILESHLQGTLLSINQRECWSQLIGAFNAYNMAAMYGVAVELGIPADEALQALSAVRSVDGRFQKIAGPDNRIGIVDYAHTPDALENVLKTLQDLNQGAQQIITVIGCGGDRDKGKRPEMARIAADRSTKAILTSDNPRSEDPEAILDDMEAGLDPVQKRRSLRISDRAQAIKLAVQLANPGDVILVAGKGHETYQEIAGVKHPFDDVATLKAQFNDL